MGIDLTAGNFEMINLMRAFVSEGVEFFTNLCSKRFGSVCTGALLLALTGKLNGKRVTTHWTCAKTLSARHPQIIVEADAL